jgi:hypothetical protein
MKVLAGLEVARISDIIRITSRGRVELASCEVCPLLMSSNMTMMRFTLPTDSHSLTETEKNM